MKFYHLLLQAGAWFAGSAAMLAHGAEPQAAPNPADPEAAVPATRYVAALPYRPAPALANSADQNWKALNRTVANYDSMTLTMDRKERDSGSGDAQASQQAAPAAAAGHTHQHGGGK